MIDATAFTDRFCAQLRDAAPDLSAKVVGPLEVVVRLDSEHRIFLENAYKLYQREPENLEAILAQFALTQIEVIANAGATAIDEDRVVPLIKDAAFIEELQRLNEERSAQVDLHYETLNEELVVLFAEDGDRDLRILNKGDTELLTVPRAELRSRATDNLRRMLANDIGVMGDAGLFMLSCGGTFEASLLLMDGIWTTDNFPVEGAFVVGVPARHSVLIVGEDDADGIERLQEACTEIARSDGYAITDTLFVRRNERWEILPKG